MGRPAPSARMTYAEYLAAEAASGDTIEIASLGVRLDVNVVFANPLGAD